MEHREINLYGQKILWLIVPENFSDTLKHYNACNTILQKAEEIFFKHIFNLNIICIIFDQHSDYARTLASLFTKEKDIRYGSVGFKNKNIEILLKIYVPITNGLSKNEEILLIAPENAIKES